MFENSQTLVTFNGRGFDLPVLETRAMKYGIPLARYFANQELRQTYRGSRYIDLYHFDLCDFLSNFGAVYRRGSLDLLAKLPSGGYNCEATIFQKTCAGFK